MTFEGSRPGTAWRSGPWLALVPLLLIACGVLDPGSVYRRQAEQIAVEGRLDQAQRRAGPFVLTTYERLAGGRGHDLVVYIEGDGRAWLSRTEVSSDPTPADPVALRLAAADPHQPLVYIARPCQFSSPSTAPTCDATYWTDRRYAPAVVDAVDAVIDRVKAEAGSRSVHLVGYSGGGVIAALIAGRRKDVADLITVAAPLDVAAWSRHHEVVSLKGSLDPAELCPGVQDLPQTHLVGADDSVVPEAITLEYVRRCLLKAASVEIVPGYDHQCCWDRDWSRRVIDLRRRLSTTGDAVKAVGWAATLIDVLIDVDSGGQGS